MTEQQRKAIVIGCFGFAVNFLGERDILGEQVGETVVEDLDHFPLDFVLGN